jgi:hypothetical protein
LKRSIVPLMAPRVCSMSRPWEGVRLARPALAGARHLVQQPQVRLHFALDVHRHLCERPVTSSQRQRAEGKHLLQVLGTLVDAVDLRVVLPLQPLRVVQRALLQLAAEQAPAVPALAVRARYTGRILSARRQAAGWAWQRSSPLAQVHAGCPAPESLRRDSGGGGAALSRNGGQLQVW